MVSVHLSWPMLSPQKKSESQLGFHFSGYPDHQHLKKSSGLATEEYNKRPKDVSQYFPEGRKKMSPLRNSSHGTLWRYATTVSLGRRARHRSFSCEADATALPPPLPLLAQFPLPTHFPCQKEGQVCHLLRWGIVAGGFRAKEMKSFEPKSREKQQHT